MQNIQVGHPPGGAVPGRGRVRIRSLIQYRHEVDSWRSSESNRVRHCLDLLCLSFRFERQTEPDERWHFHLSARSSDGLGWTHHGGWARAGGSPHYYTNAHLDFWLSFSMRPVYKIVYAPSWIHSIARLTGQHPIEVAEHYVKEGREIAGATALDGEESA